MGQIGAELANADPDKLHAAVKAVLGAHGEMLTRGAKESPATADDRLTDAAVYFHTVLELGYLVASTDGFAELERKALAELIETATNAALERTALLAHFDDLDSGTDVLGRSQRLARAAANIEDAHKRDSALRLVALIATADGHLDDTELDALAELGGHFEVSREQVEGVARDVVADITRHLEGAQ